MPRRVSGQPMTLRQPLSVDQVVTVGRFLRREDHPGQRQGHRSLSDGRLLDATLRAQARTLSESRSTTAILSFHRAQSAKRQLRKVSFRRLNLLASRHLRVPDMRPTSAEEIQSRFCQNRIQRFTKFRAQAPSFSNNAKNYHCFAAVRIRGARSDTRKTPKLVVNLAVDQFRSIT